MAQTPELSHEAKRIIASNMTIAKAILQSHYGHTAPATPVATQVRNYLIAAYADLEHIGPDVETRLAEARRG